MDAYVCIYITEQPISCVPPKPEGPTQFLILYNRPARFKVVFVLVRRMSLEQTTLTKSKIFYFQAILPGNMDIH